MAGLPESLDEVLRRALEVTPRRRFRDAQELREALALTGIPAEPIAEPVADTTDDGRAELAEQLTLKDPIAPRKERPEPR